MDLRWNRKFCCQNLFIEGSNISITHVKEVLHPQFSYLQMWFIPESFLWNSHSQNKNNHRSTTMHDKMEEGNV